MHDQLFSKPDITGEMLKEVGRLSTLSVTWMQHFTSIHYLPNQPTWPTHYLLLGRESGAYVLARLVMKGMAVRHANLTCDLREVFRYDIDLVTSY